MTNATTKTTNKALAAMAVTVMVLALTVVLGLVVGCSPQESKPSSSDEPTQKEDPMATQAVDWTMDIDCQTCHTTESGSLSLIHISLPSGRRANRIIDPMCAAACGGKVPWQGKPCV